jgi:transposase-like protein
VPSSHSPASPCCRASLWRWLRAFREAAAGAEEEEEEAAEEEEEEEVVVVVVQLLSITKHKQKLLAAMISWSFDSKAKAQFTD